MFGVTWSTVLTEIRQLFVNTNCLIQWIGVLNNCQTEEVYQRRAGAIKLIMNLGEALQVLLSATNYHLLS